MRKGNGEGFTQKDVNVLAALFVWNNDASSEFLVLTLSHVFELVACLSDSHT